MTSIESQKQYEVIKEDFFQFVAKGGMPLLEYELSNDDCLCVEILMTDQGVMFAGDFKEYSTSFSGEIKKVKGGYLLPFDFDFDLLSLDEYLQQIDLEVTEGYLIPNNLYK